MGLRELKKTRTRQAVRQAAMLLCADQGYEATTVEQIAAYAEISTATFYRYYSDKEDVVVGDFSEVIEEVFADRPEHESLFDTIRAMFEWIAASVERHREAVLMEVRLISDVPALRARRWATRHAIIDLLADLLAPRAGTSADDHELRLAIAIALAAEAETVFHWARIGGTESLASLLGDALAMIEPVLSAYPGELSVPGHEYRSPNSARRPYI